MVSTNPILLVGGTGKTGRVDARLRALGRSTRPVSRATTPSFDWTRPDGWAAALDGAGSAYVTFQPDLAVLGADAAIGRLAALARDAGLERLVLLSGRGEPGAERAEDALKAASVPWTIVQASWFALNFSESFLLDAVRSGEIALPAGPVPEPFVDADDIADVVAAALTEDGDAGKLYEVTGPRALTFAETAEILAEVTGRPIRYRQVPRADFVGGLTAAGLPPAMVVLLDELFTTVLDGRNAAPMPGVRHALGRSPRDFADYARRTAATGVWEAV